MSDFDRVKEALNVRDIIFGETGLKMKGKHLEECPLCHGHECFSLPEGNAYFKCHQCGEGGDVITFLELYHNIDKKAALERAAAKAGIELSKSAGYLAPKFSKVDRIRMAAATYYHEHMLGNGGKAYLVETRGHAESTLKQMLVGHTDGHLVDYLRKEGFEEKDILESGLVSVRDVGGRDVVSDFFKSGLYVYPHLVGGRVGHFTMKDPKKKIAPYQLPAKSRHKDWRFYNQEVLDKFNEIILVEGEDDLQSVLDAGVQHVIGMVGQISDEQINTLGAYCRGKHLYLWMDNDEDLTKKFAKGKGYVRKICQQLPDINIKVFVYPDAVNDPDDYLRDFKGDKRKEIKRLQVEALDYVSWEILQVGALENLEARHEALKDRDIFKIISRKDEVYQEIYSEKLVKVGFSEKAIKRLLEDSEELLHQIQLYLQSVGGGKQADPNAVAGIIYKYFATQGRFYFDASDTVYLIHKSRTYEIGNNTSFNALMHKMTRLIYNQAPGGGTWEALRCLAYNSGRRIDRAQWIHQDLVNDVIYMNLNSANNTILRINRSDIKEVPNGMNADHVLLSTSGKIRPFNFMPDVDMGDGMTALGDLVLNNIPCDKKQAYLVLCWMISGLVPDYAPYQALMKFSGVSGGGKSTAAKLVSTLIYGDGELGDPTGAAAYSLASNNPLLVIDNLEGRDVTRTIQKFLLLLATRGSKEKRTSGTESDTTQESPRALGCITAIEPFTLPELINRTYDVLFDRNRWGREDFFEAEILEQLKKKRNLILSSLLKFVQKEILPNLDKRREYMIILRKEYKGHAKERTNEYMALLMMILERILVYIPFYDDDMKAMAFGIEDGIESKEIRQAWIEEQNSKAKENEVTSNNIMKLLDGLVLEYTQKNKNNMKEPIPVHGYDDKVFVLDHPEYGFEMIKTKPEKREDKGESFTIAFIDFEVTSAELVYAFDRFCRNNGIKNPYESAAVFGARLGNDLPLMKKGGWELITKKEDVTHYRVVKGKRFLKFRHTLIR